MCLERVRRALVVEESELLRINAESARERHTNCDRLAVPCNGRRGDELKGTGGSVGHKGQTGKASRMAGDGAHHPQATTHGTDVFSDYRSEASVARASAASLKLGSSFKARSSDWRASAASPAFA